MKLCAICEEKKRTYKWFVLPPSKDGGECSLLCSVCDGIDENGDYPGWPKSSPVLRVK